MNLRPSSLPKLAQCAKYQSQADAGPAAQRGTNMDASFRAILAGTHVAFLPDTDSEDIAAIEWAVSTARAFAGGKSIEAREEALRIECCGMTGTADALCAEHQWSADLKTGEVRDYEAQQAAYALGFMDREFCDNWTVILLFCDARQVVTLDFTRDHAEKLVRGIVAKVKDPQAVATPCEYCDWCALRWTCAKRLEPLSMFLYGKPDELDVAGVSANPVMLGKLLAVTHEICKDGGIHDTLKEAAKSHLSEGRDVSGWTLSKGRETKTVDAVTVARYAAEIGTGKVCAAYGNMSERKFSELWKSQFGERPLPDGAISVNHGAPFVTRSRKKGAP